MPYSELTPDTAFLLSVMINLKKTHYKDTDCSAEHCSENKKQDSHVRYLLFHYPGYIQPLLYPS